VTWHTMVITEDDPSHSGFIRRYYATVDISRQGSDWVWQQVDVNGNYIGNINGTLSTEDSAKDDALKILKGNYWEET